MRFTSRERGESLGRLRGLLLVLVIGSTSF
jgi:hypothetical protein